ncbi:MAG: integrase/recombinase XerD [Microgenomates group bacterium Gr01-1014_5]|nr:MAG: integrase/recombinase XerD [Microgenomates group bacterium Gr01-1014_5]
MGLEHGRKLFQTPRDTAPNGSFPFYKDPEYPIPDLSVRAYLNCLKDIKTPRNTVDAYRSDLSQLGRYLDLRKGPHTWSSVTKEDMSGFLLSLEEHRYAPATIARKIASARAFFRWEIEDGIMRTNPLLDIETPKTSRALPRVLSKNEIAALLAAPEANKSPEAMRDSAMLRLFYATGMRVSEMASLNKDDINLGVDYVRCLRLGRERQIPFDLKTHEAIQNYLEGSRSGLWHAETDALFVSHREERLTRQGIWLIFKGYVRAVGLPEDITTHTLRRSFAVHLLADHVSLRDVGYLLGLKLPNTRVYDITRHRIPKAG